MNEIYTCTLIPEQLARMNAIKSKWDWIEKLRRRKSVFRGYYISIPSRESIVKRIKDGTLDGDHSVKVVPEFRRRLNLYDEEATLFDNDYWMFCNRNELIEV